MPKEQGGLNVMKEVIELNQHRLLCGDATNTEDVDLLIGDCKVNLLLTDPPYGIDIVNVDREREHMAELEERNLQHSTRNSWNTSQARLPQGERERAVKGKVGKPRHC